MAVIFLIAVMSIVIHEYAHALAAAYLGDYTAKSARRLTLNPFAHIHLGGTIVVPLILMFLRLPAVGWARPVPMNYYHLRRPQQDAVLIALAGPMANLLCACAVSILNRMISWPWVTDVLSYAGSINVILGFGNLLPIPFFDGWKIVTKSVPFMAAKKMEEMESYGLFMVTIFLLGGLVQRIVLPFSMRMSTVLGFRQLF